MPQERMLTPQEVADRLHCSRSQVYILIDREDLRAVRLGPRLIRVPESAVEELLEAGATHAAG